MFRKLISSLFDFEKPSRATPHRGQLDSHLHTRDGLSHRLDEALIAAQSGNVAGASEILSRLPVEAMHLPDIVAQSAHIKSLCGHLEEATAMLDSSLRQHPQHTLLLNSLGNVKRLQEQWPEAKTLYQLAITVDPLYVPARINLAAMQFSLHEKKDAEQLLLEGLRHLPNSNDIARELANIYLRQQRWKDASDLYRKALNAYPIDWDAQLHFGMALYNQDALDEAQLVFQSLLENQPEKAQAHYYLGLIYLRQNANEDAEDAFNMALHYAPSLDEAAVQLARLYKRQGHLDEAIENYREALRQSDETPSLLTEFGTALYDNGQSNEAESVLYRAICLDSQYAPARNQLGLVYLSQGRPDEAETCFAKASELDPSSEDAQFNYCIAKQDKGDLEGAVACYTGLLAHYPAHPQLIWQKAHVHLLAGDFEHAWDDYELRQNHESALKRTFPFPTWHGESLAGKSILIYAEQGLGDEIMFASCLSEVISRAKHCFLECDPRLANLFSRSFPMATVKGWKRTDECTDWLVGMPHIDLQIPIGSLPRYFRRTLIDFPNHSGYLVSDASRTAKWHSRLAGLGPGLKVGISWRGGTSKTRRDIRSIPLEQWKPILSQKGCQFVSLQYTHCEQELATIRSQFGINIHHWQEVIDDYDETASLISALDLVITVCTAVVHLTGALGRPVWVMVPAISEWRYLRQGKRMPWYPTVNLFRQEKIGEWQPVLEQLAAALPYMGQGDA